MYAKLRARLGADEIRAAMEDKPRRKWHWQKMLVNLLMVAGVLVLLWMAATDLLGPAIDHELDWMESVVMPYDFRPFAATSSPRHMTLPPEMGADLDLLAALIHAEAKGESHEGKVAVGAVVLNRVDDPRWPDTVKAVVMEPGQFAEPTEATPEARRAAQEALSGVNPVGDAMYFFNPEVSRCGWIVTRETVTEIGNHAFAR